MVPSIVKNTANFLILLSNSAMIEVHLYQNNNWSAAIIHVQVKLQCKSNLESTMATIPLTKSQNDPGLELGVNHIAATTQRARGE